MTKRHKITKAGLDKIVTERDRSPRRTLIYGVSGVGKSTFGAMAEKPSSSRPKTA